MDMLSHSLVLFILVPQFKNSQGYRLSIMPEKTRLLLLDGDKLELKCVFEHTGPSKDLSFYKNDVLILNNTGGFILGTKLGQVIATETRDSITLTKNVLYLGDDGSYKCKAGSSGLYNTEISVDVFSVTVVDALMPEFHYFEPVTPLTVVCQATHISNSYNITWEHRGKKLAAGDKYSIYENGTLIIINPERDDMGEYQCIFVFFEMSSIEKDEVKPKPPVVKACPAIISYDNDKNLVQGSELELSCEVSGYPMPTVTWYKSNMKINVTPRINFLEYKGGNYGKLRMFALEQSDEGSYMCLAQNAIAPFNASAEMTVRVIGAVSAALEGKIAGNYRCVILFVCLTITSFLKSQF